MDKKNNKRHVLSAHIIGGYTGTSKPGNDVKDERNELDLCYILEVRGRIFQNMLSLDVIQCLYLYQLPFEQLPANRHLEMCAIMVVQL